MPIANASPHEPLALEKVKESLRMARAGMDRYEKKGDPMTREEVVQKCRDLVEPVLGKANCTSLIGKVFEIEKIKDIRELRSVLQKA